MIVCLVITLLYCNGIVLSNSYYLNDQQAKQRLSLMSPLQTTGLLPGAE